jgi:exopolysaccharide biosynthesis WecB/TagA/CpsF family protein
MTIPDPAASPDADCDDVLLLDRRGSGRAVAFLGIEFAPVPMPTALRRIAEASTRTDRFRYVVTPNVDHLVRLDAQPALASLYDDAWINLCDSRIVEILARLSGVDLPVTPGSDLSAALLQTEIAADEPVVVVGGDETVISALRSRYGLTDIRWHQPPMGLRDKPEAIAEAAAFLAANPTRFHFLCVGSPQQELVAQAASRRGDVRGVGLCIGASLDFLAGKVNRAPRWMQTARLEWLHRLLSEPRRMWKRYLVEGPRIFTIWHRWRAQARP